MDNPIKKNFWDQESRKQKIQEFKLQGSILRNERRGRTIVIAGIGHIVRAEPKLVTAEAEDRPSRTRQQHQEQIRHLQSVLSSSQRT